MNVLKEKEVNQNLLAAAKMAGMDQVPQGHGVFCEWNGKRYFCSRWTDGRVYVKVSRKRSR